VDTEPKIISLKMERDARLAAAAGGVARYLADAAGLSGEGPAQLQAETVAACLQAFETLARPHLVLEIRYALYHDRLEIDLAGASQGASQAITRLSRHFGQTTANT
jgi:hypothetical protein